MSVPKKRCDKCTHFKLCAYINDLAYYMGDKIKAIDANVFDNFPCSYLNGTSTKIEVLRKLNVEIQEVSGLGIWTVFAENCHDFTASEVD